jgi:hypothetical protein
MRTFSKGKVIITLVALFTILTFAGTSVFSALSNSRIMPTQKVTMLQGDKKVGEFTKEAPLPEQTMLICQGDCGIKMGNLYLVATDGSLFSITDNSDTRELYVKEGKVYFALSSLPQSLMFKTPNAVFTAKEVMLKASTNSGSLKGYVSVTSKAIELGIIEGGSMLVSTIEGDKMIPAGNRILLAQADLSGGAASEGDKKLGAILFLGGVGAGIPILSELREDDSNDGSPHTP